MIEKATIEIRFSEGDHLVAVPTQAMEYSTHADPRPFDRPKPPRAEMVLSPKDISSVENIIHSQSLSQLKDVDFIISYNINGVFCVDTLESCELEVLKIPQCGNGNTTFELHPRYINYSQNPTSK